MKPIISIIIPLYNKAHTIKKTLATVLNQSYTNYEIIVVNDGSTDESALLVTGINDTRINLVNQTNGGVSSARNTGIREAKGKWILFLDADDTLLPNALKTLTNNIVDEKTIVAANFLIKTPETQCKYLSVKNSKFYTHANIYQAWALKKLFLRTGSFIMPTWVAKIEPYDERFSRFEDLDFLFRCFEHVRIKLIPDIVMIYEMSFAEASKINQIKWDRDYLFHLPFESTQFWKNCVFGDCLNMALKAYPSKEANLRIQYAKYLKYIVIAKIIFYCSLLNRAGMKRIRKRANRFFARIIYVFHKS